MQKLLSNRKFQKLIASLLIAGAAAVFGFKKPTSNSNGKGAPQASEVSYTKHALCRMECREINETEVLDVIDHGQINSQKTDPGAQPCPVVVKEKRTADRQLVRVVYGQCQGQTRIITVIDLDNDHDCHCK